MQQSKGKRLANTRETALYLRRSPCTLERWRCRGGGPAYIVQGPKLVVYDLNVVDTWLDANSRTSTSEPK